MRRIRGHNGLVIPASDQVASGLVAGGHAVYVEDEDSAPARRRTTKGRKSAKQEQTSNGEAENNDRSGSAGDPD